MPITRSLSLVVAFAAALVGGCAKKDGAAAAAAGGRGPEKQPVEVTPVVRRDLEETLTVVGSLAPNESAEIRPEIVGLVKGIFFDEGQGVKQGQVLMKIDDAELLAQYAQVEARYKLAELNVARSENLSESRTIPQSEVDRARSEFAATKAELALLKLRLEKTEVKAPFDGVVGSRALSAGDYVTASTVLTTLNDLSRMKITFQVPERFLGKVHNGTSFSVKSKNLDADDKVNGAVYFVSSVIERATRSSEVKGLLANPPTALRPGMFANVELILDVRRNVLTVPEGSILTSSTGPQIVVVTDGEGGKVVQFVPVELGLRAKGVVEVRPLSGVLAERQPIVASGVGALVLFPGAKVEPRPLRAEFLNGGEDS